MMEEGFALRRVVDISTLGRGVYFLELEGVGSYRNGVFKVLKRQATGSWFG